MPLLTPEKASNIPRRHFCLSLILCGWAMSRSLTVTGAELDPAPEGTFSIAIIPDTQHYKGRGTKAEPDSQAPLTNITPKGRMTWTKRLGSRGNSPQQMWDKCFREHANLFLICCGDQSRTQALRLESTGDHGNTVHEVLSDYGADGLRIMRFIPSADRIEVRTWNPLTQALCESTSIVKDRDQHQFSLYFEMK